MLLGLLLAGCGVKTPPQPAELALAPPGDLAAWRRPEDVVVRWRVPDDAERAGGVRAYDLLVRRLPWYCRTCAAETVNDVRIDAHDEALVRRGPARYYRVVVEAPRTLLGVQVRARFGAGTGPFTAPVFVEGTVAIPTPALEHERVEAGAGGAVVRLRWPLQQARVVHRIGRNGVPVAEVAYYEANVYRREPGTEWPLWPLNGRPLSARQWLVPLGGDPEAVTQEYTVRYVDAFGNEGPPAPPVTVVPGGTASPAGSTQ